MKKLICFLLVAGSVSPAFARDSTWRLCTGVTDVFEAPTKIAVNLYEHRNGPDKRETKLTFIYGSYILQGSFDNTESDSATVKLKQGEDNYSGLVEVDYQNSTLTLNGTLDVSNKTPIKATLQCEDFGEQYGQ